MKHLFEQLKRHEGFRSRPYRDSVGVNSIGFGRNLDHVGISESEAEMLLTHDVNIAINELNHNFSFFTSLNSARQDVLINMVFNLGITRFKTFRKAIGYIEKGHFTLAAIEMLDSLWAEQVGFRALELAEQMRTGIR